MTILGLDWQGYVALKALLAQFMQHMACFRAASWSPVVWCLQ